ncbi:hypothetical protein [Lacihabitans sp. CCS-44]|uniref:hypothetical protein n=1 Tax=Lacihabitans sp. CCS-44 TaxID=2487331 RepID=UPI0020CEF213|nr:hypothetical protein [Lacihabitans sp. CCS-44]
MIDKLNELKSRAENLRYNDEKELDDIVRKTIMYVDQIFPMKPTYQSDVKLIKFKPSFYVSGMGEQPYRDSWNSGQQKLINFLDTRIEEKELELKTTTKIEQKYLEPRIVEKIVTVQDNARIEDLIQENTELRKSKSLWNRINWAIFIPSILTALGGAFVLGIYIGKAQFDTEKLELFQKNQILENRNDSLNKEADISNIKIQNLTKLIPEDFVPKQLFPLKIQISFSSPTSIFDGEILVSAKKEFDDIVLLEFKGINGLSADLSKPYDSLNIQVKEGDRFYLKSESKMIYVINVLSTTISCDIEIMEKK